MRKDMHEYLREIDKKTENFNVINYRINRKSARIKRLSTILAVVICVMVIGISSPKIYAKLQEQKKYDEYIRRNYVSGNGILAASYSEKVDMDYVYQNGFGIKIDSIILTDDTFKANINMILPEEMRVDKLPENQTEDIHIFYDYGYAVYDENNTIFACNNRLDNLTFTDDNSNYILCLYKELGIRKGLFGYDFSTLGSSGSNRIIEKNDENIVAELSIRSQEGFPNSKKLYIRIFNIGYSFYKENEDGHYSDSNDLEWIFEIETPEKFLKRETINLILMDDIPGLKINKFTISETGMILNGKMGEITDTMAKGKDMDNWSEVQDAMLNITDIDGNIYYPVEGGGSTSDKSFHNRFEIDKDLFNETTLYLNMRFGDKEYSSQIVQK